MAKETGLGDNFYIGGYNISGDVGSLGSISGGPALLELTGIDKLAIERLGGQRTGMIEFSAFWNVEDSYPYSSHRALKTRATTDTIATYFRGTTIGNAAASCVAKQINYDPTRAADGSLTSTTQVLSNGYGLEWGRMLTAGARTDTGATDGASIDTAASLSFGGQAYLQVSGFVGTDVTIKIQDSANDSTWADVSGFAFAQTVSGLTTQRIALSNTATIRRYVRAVSVTTGGFSSCVFAVMVVKNELAGQVF